MPTRPTSAVFLHVDEVVKRTSSKGVKAWAVRHAAGVQHQDVLVERLRRIISELASL